MAHGTKLILGIPPAACDGFGGMERDQMWTEVIADVVNGAWVVVLCA